MAQLKVTQIKSAIGTKPNQRQTLRSLGLKRIHDSVVQEDRPEIRGMVATVPHLVTVEESLRRRHRHDSEGPPPASGPRRPHPEDASRSR